VDELNLITWCAEHVGGVSDAYQDLRGRPFTADEYGIAWAASLWPAAHNARWEALHGDPPLSSAAVRAQAGERLRRANA
jgi:hypothetical protein